MRVIRWSGVVSLVLGLFWASNGLAGSPTLKSVEDLTVMLAARARAAGMPLRLEDVLTRLGADYPELRANYSLLYDSQSRQAASAEFPRVISFTSDGRFVLAFHGDPRGEGFDEIEMAEFSADPPRGPSGYRPESFKFRRIVFQPMGARTHTSSSAIPRSYPEIRPVNEPLCLTCHGAAPRPNWESYAIWDGTYFRDDHHRWGTKYALSTEGPEHALFDQFYTRQAGKGRYAFLADLEARYLTRIPDSVQIPESQMTQALGHLNYRRVSHLIMATPRFDAFKYALFGALYDCPDFEGFFPPDVLSQFARPLSHYVENTRQQFVADRNYYHLRNEHEQTGKFRLLFEGRGISMEKWSMSFRRGPTFVTPGGSLQGFITSTLLEYDPSLEPYRLYRFELFGRYGITTEFTLPWTGSWTTYAGSACNALRLRSLSALSQNGR